MMLPPQAQPRLLVMRMPLLGKRPRWPCFAADATITGSPVRHGQLVDVLAERVDAARVALPPTSYTARIMVKASSNEPYL